jgi:sortase A
MTSATIETASSDDEVPRPIIDPQLAKLIRATLAAAGVSEEGSDTDFETALVRHLDQDGGADYAAAVGAALVERYVACRSQPGPEMSPAPVAPAAMANGTLARADKAASSINDPAAGVARYSSPTDAPDSTWQTARGIAPVVAPASGSGAEPSPKPSRAAARKLAYAKRSRAVVVFTWARNIGLIILLFVAWQLWGTGLVEHHAQESLASQFARQTNVEYHAIGPPQLASVAPSVLPAVGALVARLQIPAISLSQYVVEGTTESDLGEGPGHYVGTALPGYTGNVAIAGHRTTYGAPFNRLGQVVPGDLIYLTTMSGERFTYRVLEAPVAVLPTDVAVLDSFRDDRVTLTTCNPEFSASQRLVVVGVYVPPKVAQIARTTSSPAVSLQRSRSTPSTTVVPNTPTTVRGAAATSVPLAEADQVGWNWSHLPMALLLAVLLIALGMIYGRVYRRFGWASWIVLGPAWVAGLVFFFEALAALSPTTL